MRKVALIVLGCLISSVCWLQSDWPEPYNPDVDTDGIIGVQDLVGFLQVFGSYWDPVYGDFDPTNEIQELILQNDTIWLRPNPELVIPTIYGLSIDDLSPTQVDSLLQPYTSYVPRLLLQGIDGPQGPMGPEGPIGATGPQGLPGSHFLVGNGIPPDSLGMNGDMYLDSTNFSFYGPKQALTGWLGPYSNTSSDSAPDTANFVASGNRIGFAQTTTWTCPESVNSIMIELWGAGGSSGNTVYCSGYCAGSSNSWGYGGAGGNGGYLKQTVAVTPGTSYQITIGNAGSTNTYFGEHSAEGGGNGTNGHCNSGSCASNGTTGTNGSVINFSNEELTLPSYIPTSYLSNIFPDCCAAPGEPGFAIIHFGLPD